LWTHEFGCASPILTKKSIQIKNLKDPSYFHDSEKSQKSLELKMSPILINSDLWTRKSGSASQILTKIFDSTWIGVQFSKDLTRVPRAFSMFWNSILQSFPIFFSYFNKSLIIKINWVRSICTRWTLVKTRIVLTGIIISTFKANSVGYWTENK